MTILVGYIPTRAGDDVLNRAVAEARRRQDRLTILNSARGEAAVERHRLYEEASRSLAQRLEETGIEFELRTVVRPEEPSEAILAAAEDGHVDLIVIGVRRRSLVGKLIMGSTAQRVLLQAPCDVLAVKVGEDRHH